MRLEGPKRPDSCPVSALAGRSRKLLLSALALSSALSGPACSDDETEAPAPKGWGCVSVLDQQDDQMDDCVFDYELTPEGKDAENCDDGQLFLHGTPGRYKVNAECGKLAGHVDVKIEEGENEPTETRLINSYCYNDDSRIILDAAHRTADLSDYMGFSTDTRCANWFSESDTRNAEISNRTLQCDSEIADCNPEDGRDYLKIMGENGEYSNGEPIHLKVEAVIDMVPAGKEVTVKATIRQLNGAEQEIEIPVIIQGRQSTGTGSGGTGGAEGTGGSGGN